MLSQAGGAPLDRAMIFYLPPFLLFVVNRDSIGLISYLFDTHTDRPIFRENTNELKLREIIEKSWKKSGKSTTEWCPQKEVSELLASISLRATLDPRLRELPLMDNPLVNTVSVAIYLFIVKYAGPKFMENRKPFEFRRLLFVYNIGLVLLSAWMFYEVPFIIMSNRLFQQTTVDANIRADSSP